MSAVEAPIWTPASSDWAEANVASFIAYLEQSRGLQFSGYESLWEWSVTELELFWEAVWDFYDVQASRRYGEILTDRRIPAAGWFRGARLNYAAHVLSRAPRDSPAIVWVDEGREPLEFSREWLVGKVGALAAELRAMNVRPGDRIAAYLPNIPEAVVAMLAVTSVGAIWAACSPDFGTQSVIERFAQLEPSVLIAVDGYRWGGREYDRLDVVDELRRAIPTIRHTVVVRSLGPEAPTAEGIDAFDEITREPRAPEFTDVDFDHPLWALFSSGTTGVPKAIVQGHGGILLEHLKSLGLCMDLRPGDNYLFFSSTSWMAWNYLVAGLLHGATIVLYSGSPGYPDASGLWRVAERTRATVLAMGSAFVTGCQKSGVRLRDAIGLEALRLVIPTGSPLPPRGWSWLQDELDARVRIDSICGGTDVCTAFFGGSRLLPVHAGEISGRWLGIKAEAWDGDGRPVVDQVGEFVITAPMPSMPLALWNDPGGERLHDSYFSRYPGAWHQGDWITIRSNGAVVVHGRSDATLNRGGVRMGSAEIYAAVEHLDEIADSLIVGVELPDGGYYMPLFVVLSDGAELNESLLSVISAEIRTRLSPRHVPDEVVRAPAVPRTLTGKKLEVPIKRILQGASPKHAAALGAIDRSDVLDWYAAFAAERLAARGAAREAG
jgi:acetoacetyl-CoA synthetase